MVGCIANKPGAAQHLGSFQHYNIDTYQTRSNSERLETTKRAGGKTAGKNPGKVFTGLLEIIVHPRENIGDLRAK
jgi:hypothetical protein